MEKINCELPGCFEILTDMRIDARGGFVKTFNIEIYKSLNIQDVYKEEYYTISKKGVLRGMHFQVPPYQYSKIVYCVYGKIFDVLLDLRVGSPTYKEHKIITLDSDKGNMIYMPEGIAHGFYTLSKKAIVMYKVSKVYSVKHDDGVRWDTAGIQWPDKNPITSNRDTLFLGLDEFVSPFRYIEA